MPGVVQILVSAEAAKAIAELGAVRKEIGAVGSTGEKTAASSGRMGRAMRTGSIVAAGALGVLALGLKDAVGASSDFQATQAKAATAVHNAGLSWAENKDAINENIRSMSEMSGFMQTDLDDAFANFIRTTGNVPDALHLTSLAMDVARTKSISLASAQSLLARVANGSYTGLKRLGISVTPVTTATDKLAAATGKLGSKQTIQLAHGERILHGYDEMEASGKKLTKGQEKQKAAVEKQVAALKRLAVNQGNATDKQKKAAKAADDAATKEAALATVQQKFGGQAKAFGDTTSGAMERLHSSVEELEISIGTGLLPVVASFANGLAHSVNFMAEHTSETRIAGVALASLATAFLVARAAAAISNSSLVKFARSERVAAVASRILAASMYGIPLVAIVAGVVAIGVALVVLYRKSQTFRNIVNGAFNAVRSVAGAAADFIKSHWQILVAFLMGPLGLAVLFAARHWDQIKSAASSALGPVISAAQTLAGWLGTAVGWVGRLADAISSLPSLPDLPSLPGFAAGTRGAPGGLATVAEHGAELVMGPQLRRLAPGTRVVDAGRTRGILGDWRHRGGGSGGVTVIVEAGALDSLAARRNTGRMLATEVMRALDRSGREI